MRLDQTNIKTLIVGIVSAFIAVGLAFCIFELCSKTSQSYDKSKSQRYSRYVKDTSNGSGYSVYYNGLAVSGSALGITKNNIDDYGGFGILCG